MNDSTTPHKLMEALAVSGFAPDIARQVEAELKSSIEHGIERHRQHDHQALMTQADGISIQNNLRTEMAEMKTELRQEMVEMGTQLRAEMNELGTQLRAEIKQLGTELRVEMTQLEVRLMRYIHDHSLKMLGLHVAATGLMLTAFKFFH